MRETVVLVSILLFSVGAAWAEEPGSVTLATNEAADVGEAVCGAEKPLPEGELELAAWAEEHGFEQIVPMASTPPSAICPAIINCSGASCVQTSICQTQDTGNNGCCPSGGGICLLCPAGQTIHVKQCRCSGTSCTTDRSQTYFCA